MQQVMIVTGGSQGIGAAVARLAAGLRYAVAFTYQSNRPLADAVADEIKAGGGQSLAVQAEMADEASILTLFRVGGRHVRAGHRAGEQRRHARTDHADRRRDRPAILDTVLAVNVRAPFLLIREAVKRMATDLGGPGGAIVNVSSRAAGLGGAGEWIHYAASKGALDSLTIGASRELAPRGIRVNAVSPGLIETDLHARAGAPDRLARLAPGVPMGRSGSAEEVAERGLVAAVGRRILHHGRQCPGLRRTLIMDPENSA